MRNQYGKFAIFLATFLGIVNGATADDVDYELGLSLANFDMDVASPIGFIGGTPGSALGRAENSTDTDRLELSATWYYSGLQDAPGPRSRAAFLDRASSIVLSYAYEDSSSDFSSTGIPDPLLPPGIGPFPPSTGGSDGTGHFIEARLRHVWGDSAWYGLAGLSHAEIDLDSVFNGNSSSFSEDSDAWAIGLGRYIGASTSLEVGTGSVDILGEDATTYSAALSHVGQLGANWHYAADLGITVFDSFDDREAYSLGLSAFPNRELEIGIRATLRDSEFDLDEDSYELFSSWFIRENVEIRARYREDDRDSTFVTEFDSSELALGVNVRF